MPRHTAVRVRRSTGRELTGPLIDVSLSGAALTLAEQPAIGTAVTVGRTPGRVVRHFEGGIARGVPSPSPDRFDENRSSDAQAVIR